MIFSQISVLYISEVIAFQVVNVGSVFSKKLNKGENSLFINLQFGSHSKKFP